MSVRSNSFNSFNSSNSSNKSTKKTGKFCKVCFDSGKDESIYTSHFVKSAPSLGVIVCPTLKATECRYCKKSGHTVKFCKVLIIRKKEDDRYASRVRYDRVNIIPVMATSTKKRNMVFLGNRISQCYSAFLRCWLLPQC